MGSVQERGRAQAVSKCRVCGASIVWFDPPNGERLRVVDPKYVGVAAVRVGQTAGVKWFCRDDGSLVRGVQVGLTQGERVRVLHSFTCLGRKAYRANTRKRTRKKG